MKKLLVIFGSTRPTRAGLPVAEWVVQAVRESGRFDVTLADLAEIDLPLLDEPEHPVRQNYTQEHTKRWSAIVAAADAFIFVTPEYDYFPPAALVNAVQFLSREWSRKPAGIVSYGGISGGLRSTQALRLLLSGVNLMTLSNSVPLPQFTQFLGESGALHPTEPMSKGLTSLIKDLHDFFSGRG